MNFIPFLVLFSLAYRTVAIIIFIRFNHSNNNRSVTSSAFVRLISKVLWLFNMVYTDTPIHRTTQLVESKMSITLETSKRSKYIETWAHTKGVQYQINFKKSTKHFRFETNMARCDQFQFWRWASVDSQDIPDPVHWDILAVPLSELGTALENGVGSPEPFQNKNIRKIGIGPNNFEINGRCDWFLKTTAESNFQGSPLRVLFLMTIMR